MITEYQWTKQSLSELEGGNLIHDWLNRSRYHDERTLIVCGAGLSMTGANPAPSGWHVGDAYENSLRMNGNQIPEAITGNIAKLYEHFCYPIDEEGNKIFSQKKHDEFIESITASNHIFRFSGRPNFQHHSLLNEVIESNGNIRIYSLNLDEFFEVASIFSESYSGSIVVNATELVNKPKSHRVFSDWRILAAHGKNALGQQSVWSESLLVNDINEPLHDHLHGEKQIIRNAVECIKQGPYYEKVIFVGVAAPLTYLINILKGKLTDECEWVWINPFTPPQEWLINNLESPFKESNGNWIQAGLTECLWQAHSNFYLSWLSASCGMNIESIPLIRKYENHNHKKTLVESIYRARRIYDKGIQSVVSSSNNQELLSSMNDNKDVYSYPNVVSGNKYQDSNLGIALHKLFLSTVELTSSSTERAPQLTVANKISDIAPISAHIFKFELSLPDNKVAEGIARTFDEAFISPNHRHIIIIDVQSISIHNLVKAIETELISRFPNNYMYIDVTTTGELDTYLNSCNFSIPPERAMRP